MTTLTSTFTSALHILADQAEWDQLTFRLEQLLLMLNNYKNNHNKEKKKKNSHNNNNKDDDDDHEDDEDDDDDDDHEDEDDDENTVTTTSTVNAEQIATFQKYLRTGEGPHSWTPLMLSCARAPPPHVIELLLKCSPESANISDYSGMFPLHFVCFWWNGDDYFNTNSSVMGSQLDGQHDDGGGSAAAAGNNNNIGNNFHRHEGQTMMDDGSIYNNHHAHQTNINFNMNRGGQQQQDNRIISNNEYFDQDRLETNLHKVLRMLVRVCPKVLSCQNQWGMTPLHSIFDRDDLPSVETVKILLGLSKGVDCDDDNNDNNDNNVDYNKGNSGDDDDDSDSDSDGDSDGNGDDTDDIQNIIQSFAFSALSKPDSKSYLPIHTAASKGASEEVLRLLISLYPESATSTTANGDLPIHLLQYWAEDEAKNFTARSDNNIRRSNWLFDSGVFRVSKSNLFNSVTVGQIECLLEPLCAGFIPSSGNDSNNNTTVPTKTNADEIDEKDKILRRQSMLGNADMGNRMFPISESDEIDAGGLDLDEYERNTVDLASRLPGSRNVYLPIHIAAEHGVSFNIISALCEKYPEGVATPQPIGKSILGSSRSGSSRSLSSSVDDSTKRRRAQEMYPIEIFECGRAGQAAAKIARTKKRHVSNPYSSNAITSKIPISSSMDVNQMLAELRSFDERSDLLFAYYPDAIPSTYREERHEIRKQNAAKLERLSKSHTRRRRNKKITNLYRKDNRRMRRIEQRIRDEALHPSLNDFSVTAKLAWLWMYQGVNVSEARTRGNHQGSIGRIITNLSKNALLKLSYHVHVSKNMYGSPPESLESFERVPCLIQGRSILDMAKDRAAKISMEEMLLLDDEKFGNNWRGIVCEYLNGKDGLQFNSICRKTRGAGLRYVPEYKLLETGRTWNFTPLEKEDDPETSEFWQHLDSCLILPECTHTVIVKYYLEVSETSDSSTFIGKSEPFSPERVKGGLMVVSESGHFTQDKGGSFDEQIEESKQKRILNSAFATRSGCEVSLSFRYKPGLSYSLRAHGPFAGGRVSVSNARIQQVIYSLDRCHRVPFHMLLTSQDLSSPIPITTQVKMILDGPTDSSSTIPLHLALKLGASVEILNALISMNPSSLLKRNEEGCTPLHYVFLVSDEITPSLGVVKSLLTTPGENATRLKDSADRLPLHIAAERGANAVLLELLIEANTDGCYRKNRDGDLPIHLLIRSGKATHVTVEMLLTPIVDSQTICGVPGSQGLELPLHIAAEYNCSYKIMESLLLSNVGAASIPRRRSDTNGHPSPPMYALDIFEANRKKDSIHNHIQKVGNSRSVALYRSYSGLTQNSDVTEEVVKVEMERADFDLRSDLIFVFFPFIPTMGGSGDAYRKDINRIKRLQNLIRTEARNCGDYPTPNNEAHISEMAQFAWSFFCTFEDPSDPNDEYSGVIGQILKGLSKPIVQILSAVRNPFSSPVPNMPIIDCATAKCKRLISSRLLFVGRFTLDPSNMILHKSEDSLILAAIDHGMEEAFKRFVATFKKEEEIKDIDDIASYNSGNISHMLSFGDDAQSLFVDFAVKLGFDEDAANNEYERLVSGTQGEQASITAEFQTKNERKEMTLEVFRQFCDSHRVDNSGLRGVIIKFMKNRTQFLREKVARARLNTSETDWCIFPIIEDYDVDRAEGVTQTLDTSTDSYDDQEWIMNFGRTNWTCCDSKDSIYAMDVIENNVSGHDFSSFKYALVLPCGDKNLSDVLLHEDLDGVRIRDLLQKVGAAVSELHDGRVVHGSLMASNIMRIDSHIGLIDFDSATLFESKVDFSILSDKVLGVSQKITSGVLPPELIARIDLSRNGEQLHRYEQYWMQVSSDALDFSLLNQDDVHTISSVLKSFQDMDKALNMTQGALGALLANTIHDSKDETSEISWREKLSEALQDISVVDLPDTLANCEAIEEFRNVWNRIKSNARLWERIRPRISNDGRYAYFVKYHDDTSNTTNHDDLPYDLVTTSCKIDIWAFGVLLFGVCSRSSLFHVTFDGQLHNNEAYEELFLWNQETAKRRISSSIKDPLAQDLLLKLLASEDERISSMENVLQHPFFGHSSSIEAQNILEEYEERQLKNIETHRMQEIYNKSRNKKQLLSMEKHCKVVFDRLEDIEFPTSLIVLPYKLGVNAQFKEFKISKDQQILSLGEKVGDQLIRLHTVLAKLSFWLQVKENLSQKDGAEFKRKIMSWIQRARSEGSHSIAKEIVTAVGCDERYEGICIEMLDEEMNVSNARAFIRDPMKAAAMLMEGIIDSLLGYYSVHFLYLIDESHGIPSTCQDANRTGDNTYPLRIEPGREEFKETLLPFMIMTMMIATSVDGLEGLGQLVGFPALHAIPKTWIDSNVGFLPLRNCNTSLQPMIVQFSTLYSILRKQLKEIELPKTRQHSIKSSESADDNELGHLKDFFTANDPHKSFAGLSRTSELNDTSLTFWTSKTASDHQQPYQNEEFRQALNRVEKLQKEIEGKKKLEEEVIILNKRITELKKETEARVLRRNQKAASKKTQKLSKTGGGTSVSRRNSNSSSSNNNISKPIDKKIGHQGHLPVKPLLPSQQEGLPIQPSLLTPKISTLYNNPNELASRWSTSTEQTQTRAPQSIRENQEETAQKTSENPVSLNTPNDASKANDQSQRSKKSVFFI